MKPRVLIGLAAAAVIAVFGSRWLDQPEPAAPPEPSVTLPQSAPEQPPAGPLVVRDVTVRDTDGRIAWRGDVDLQPHLSRIEAGERDPHRTDGGVFGNRERLLPARPSGYYREYVVRTPGITHAGPQRLVIGKDGEVFYTFDHYRSFQRIR